MPKTDTDYQLISPAAFHSMWKRRAKRSDYDCVQIFKASGGLDPQAKAAAADDRSVPFILSNPKKDREGDTIQPAWELAQYKRNPVVTAFHDTKSLPVAKASNVRVDGDTLKATDTFTTADENPMGDAMLKMIRGGFLSACSVGFVPGEFEPNEYGGLNFTKGHSLIEHAIVGVPAHPDALVEAKHLGIDTSSYARYIERLLDAERSGATADASIRKQLERLRAQTDPNGRRLFVALSRVKLPSSAPAADDAERAEFLAMQSTLHAAGTNLSMASDAIVDLLNTTEPAGGDAADEEANDIASLTVIAQNCAAASSALANVAAQATALGGELPKSQGLVLSKAARREAIDRLRATVQRVGARHNQQDVQMIQQVHDLAGALGATSTAACAPAEDPKSAEFLALDDDEVDLDRLNVTDRDIAAAVGRAVAVEIMKITGVVD